MLTWTAKDTDATLDYRWEPPLDAGDTLASASVTLVEGDVAINTQDADDTGLTVVLSGGMVGANLFRGVWASTGGRSGDEYIRIRVIDNGPTTDATGYGSDDGFRAWLTQHGHNLPRTAPSPAVLRARGTIYVDSYETRWTGQRTGGVMQELAWPRTDATANCVTPIASDVIPPSVITASYRAAWLEASTPGILAGPTTTPGRRIKRQRVEGAVEREFFDDGPTPMNGGPSFIDATIDGLLSAFICDAKGGAFIWSLG